jgi:hypothetical protein
LDPLPDRLQALAMVEENEKAHINNIAELALISFSVVIL